MGSPQTRWQSLKSRGYWPRDVYDKHAELREAIDRIASGFFSRGDRSLFAPFLSALLERDDYMVLADYPSYVSCQDEVAGAYRNEARWTRMSILNVARMGRFSSDRAIREYCAEIWNVQPLHADG